jgi:hypothetical protein
MEILRSNITNSLELLDKFDNYLKKIEGLVDVDRYAEIFKKLKKQPEIELHEKMQSKTSSKAIAEIFDVYGNYISYFTSLDNFINLLENGLSDIMQSSASTTLKATISTQLQSIRASYIILIEHEHDAAVIDSLTKQILTVLKSDNVIEFVSYLGKLYHKNHETVSLYANLIQEILNQYDKNPTIETEIMSIVESDKDTVLSGEATSIFTDKKIHLTNPPLQRFGLIPITDYLSLSQLLKIILVGTGIPYSDSLTLAKLEKLAEKHSKYGFVIMNHIVFTPIEYNIRSLILKSAASSLIQPDEYGPTEKMVKRFRTIQSFKNKKWKFSYDVYGKSVAENFFILETLEGDRYRCLAPWIHDKQYYVPVHRVQPLINYITSKNKPSRVIEYQTLAIKQAMKHMFLPKALAMESYEDKSSEVPAHVIRQEILFELKQLAKYIIDVEYHGNISTPLEIVNVLHDLRFRDMFYEKILGMYPKAVLLKDVQSFDAGDFPFSELLSSFLVDLQNNTRKFMKELHDGYVREPLKSEVFEAKEESRMIAINEKIFNSIEKAIELVIRDKDNLYSSLHYKYMLLNFHG